MNENNIIEDSPEFVGERLKALREIQGFSQRELAKRSGVTHSNISMIEQGQVSPSIQSLSRILSAFQISIPDFFNRTDVIAPRLARFKNDIFGVASLADANFSVERLTIDTNGVSRVVDVIRCQKGVITPINYVSERPIMGQVVEGAVLLRSLSGDVALSQGDVFFVSIGDYFAFQHQGKDPAQIILS